MKKTVFAIQVFGLIAMIPAYLLAEFNHGTAKASVSKSSIEMTQQVQKPHIHRKGGSMYTNGYAFGELKWYPYL